MGAAKRRGTLSERMAKPLGPQLNHKVDKPLGRFLVRTENKRERALREHKEGLARVAAMERALKASVRGSDVMPQVLQTVHR